MSLIDAVKPEIPAVPVYTLKVRFAVQDQGNMRMQQRLDITCPNEACGEQYQLAVWTNDGSESLRSLICPKCGKKLYTVAEKDDENGGK